MKFINPKKEDNYASIPIPEKSSFSISEELLVAVQNNDTVTIQRLVSADKNLLTHKYPQYGNENILIIACDDQYSISTKKETIRKLCQMGANPQESSRRDHWEPIHYTARYANKEKMEAIIEQLSAEETNSLVYCSGDLCPEKVPKSFSNNALSVLLKYGKLNKHFNECFKLLIQKGVSCDQKDSNGTTPLDLMDEDLIQILREISPGINHKTGFKFDRLNSISELKKSDLVEVNGTDGSEERFSSCTLLQLYCAEGLVDCAEYILKRGASPDKIIPKNPDPPIMIAIMEDHESIVKILLDKNATLSDDVLLKLQIMYNTKDVATIDKYMKIVLQHLSKMSDLEKYLMVEDELKRTPLHYATYYGCPDNISRLLAMGSSLIAKDIFGSRPLDSIEPSVLEKFFDSCIGISEDNSCENKAQFVAQMDYRSLLSTVSPKEAGLPESEFLQHMIKVPALNHLIIHPLVLTFLALKWQKLQWLVYLDLSFYFLAYTTFVIYGAAFAAMTETSNFIVLIGLFLLVFRTIVRMLILRSDYIKRVDNIIDLFLLGGVVYIVVAGWVVSLRNRNLLVAYSVVLLTSTLGVFTQLRNFSFFTIKVIMLQQISINFFKYIAFFMYPILAFSFCFFMLCEEKKDMFFRMIYETVTMYAGDTQADFPRQFMTNPIFSHFIYLVFIVLICIILNNLLIGLAVSDLQEIQKQADFIDKKERSRYIANIEKIICGKFQTANTMKPMFGKLLLYFCVIENDRILVLHALKSGSICVSGDQSHGKRIRDRKVAELLQDLYKNVSLRNKEVENPYTLKSLHERMQKIETLMLQGFNKPKKGKFENRATVW